MKQGLARLLKPQSVAVIGGGVWCENIIRQCEKIGFAGELYVVHPSRKELAGVHCHKHIADLPHAPDAAFVGVNRYATIDVVDELAKIGTGGAVCFASGFKEAENEDDSAGDLQARLLRAAGDMALIGPNCYGFINYLDGALLWPDEHGGKRVARGVAIITQSSNIAINITMQKRGLPIAYLVTVGNQAQTGLSQVGVALLADERVTALGLHIEGIDDLRRFVELALFAQKCGKKIVCLKVGRSQLAQVATISHTASLAGSDASARALLQRLAIARVASLPELLEALKIVHTLGGLSSHTIASASCSGGEASLIADSALNHNVDFRVPDERQISRLRALLGPLVAISNPLDYHTYIWGDHEKMAAVFAEMARPPTALLLVVLDIPRRDRCDASAWLEVVNCLVAARALSGGNIALLASLPENLPEDLAEELIGKKIVPLCGINEALTAIAALAEVSVTGAGPQPVLRAQLPAQTRTLSEHAGKRELEKAGIPVPARAEVATPRQALARAAVLGYPVAVKASGVAHKTEAGGVALNLADDNQLTAALQSMPGKAFLVEKMIKDCVAELLVGAVLDAAHGYTLTLAAGGVLSEMLQDSVCLMIPSTRDEIEKALATLKIHGVLCGYRNQPAADRGAIVDVIMGLQKFVESHAGKIVEVEINPLMCGRTGAVAADALIKTGDCDV